MTDLDRVKYLDSILVPLRGFDGHGHFKTLLVSLRRRALYEIFRKTPKFKRSSIWTFSLVNNSL